MARSITTADAAPIPPLADDTLPPDSVHACPQTPAQQVFDLINRRRTEAGLLPLKIDARLVAAAREHAEDMARGARFGHTGSDGTQPADRVAREGYRYQEVGENVAAGIPSAEEVVKDWMGSEAHRHNILGGYEDTGIAYVHMRFSRYGTYWVQVFGTLQPSEKPKRVRCAR